MTRQNFSKAQHGVNHDLCLNFHVFLAFVDTSPREKWFGKYAKRMWSESYSANVDIRGRLYDIPQFFNNCPKNILIQI